MDINSTHQMLNHLFEDDEGYLCFVRARRVRSKGGLRIISQVFIDNQKRRRKTLVRFAKSVQPDEEVYVTALLYKSEDRHANNVQDEIWSLYADGDGATVPPHLPQPTLVLETSPGRHHYVWRLSKPVSPAQALELNKRLARALGADPSGADLAQLLRVPGTPNHKYANKPLVGLMEVHDDIDD